MSLYPADDIKLPDTWSKRTPRPQDPYELVPEEIAENREAWIEAWTAIMRG